MPKQTDRFKDVWDYFAGKTNVISDERLQMFDDMMVKTVYQLRKDFTKEEADDIAQEAIQRSIVMAKEDAIKKDFRFTAFNAVRGAIRDYERQYRNKRKNQADVDDEADRITGREHESAEDKAFLRQIVDEVLSEVDKLLPRDREIIRLIYIEGYRQVQVAEKLGIEKKQISECHARALNRLRKKFAEIAEYREFIVSRQVARVRVTSERDKNERSYN